MLYIKKSARTHTFKNGAFYLLNIQKGCSDIDSFYEIPV